MPAIDEPWKAMFGDAAINLHPSEKFQKSILAYSFIKITLLIL